MEKIRAIVAKGQGVPDQDCPTVSSLMRFWVSTSIKEIDTNETKQEAQVRMQADAQAVVGLTAPTSSTTRIGADGMQAMLQSLQAPAVDEDPGLAGLKNMPLYNPIAA